MNHSYFSKSMVNNERNQRSTMLSTFTISNFLSIIANRLATMKSSIDTRDPAQRPNREDEKDRRQGSRSNSGSRGFSHGWPPLAAWQGQHRYTFSATRRELRSPRLPTQRFGGRTLQLDTLRGVAPPHVQLPAPLQRTPLADPLYPFFRFRQLFSCSLGIRSCHFTPRLLSPEINREPFLQGDNAPTPSL